MHETVIGSLDGDGKKARIAELFAQLPEVQQQEIRNSYQVLQEKANKGFWTRSSEAIRALLFQLPPFMQAWLFFSFCVCIMLLMRIEGAALAAWVLPLVTLVYAVDNGLNGGQREQLFDSDLFPSEQYLVECYLGHPLVGGIGEQHQQLLDAWRRYLVKEWGGEVPGDDPEALAAQAEKGEHAFHVARLQRYRQADHQQGVGTSNIRKPTSLLLVYFAWNLFFAFYVNRKET
jgi:hypothetical protein